MVRRAKGDDPLTVLAATDPADLKRPTCLIVRTLAGLEKDRADTVRFLIDESGHSAGRISKACKAAGINLSDDSIQKHRRRDCPCP